MISRLSSLQRRAAIARHSASCTGAFTARSTASCSQDVFAIALERLPELVEPPAFANWILAIARHHAIDHARVVRSNEELVDVPAPLARNAELAKVVGALRELPEAYRETMIMRLVEGMTGAEIADQTGLSHGNVRVTLHRGMKLLRERLGMPVKEKPDGQ
jgi:RNA polymerase sigma-70 factor (ECF subfamily)